MKMSMEQPPLPPVEPEMVEELEERQPTAFEESASQLLTMLDKAPNRTLDPRYYSVSWDQQEPGRITSLTSLTVRATGARKQELHGEFYQAQFEVTHRGQDGSASYDFIWAETGAQRRGNPIIPNQAAFARDYGYQPLRITNVAKMLADRVKTMDDCTFLLRSLKDRTGISMASSYIANTVNTFTSDFAHRDFTSLKTGDMTENVSKLFELLREAQGFGQDVPKSTQGFLVSRLLRAVANKQADSDPAGLNPQEALDILGAALDQNVITSPHAKQRVFGSTPIYQYPSSVERMHEYLEDPKYNKGPKNIVGVERVTFAAGFVMARLREEQLPAVIAEKIAATKLVPPGVQDRVKQNREILGDLLLDTARALGASDNELHGDAGTGTSSTFAYVLELLHPDADEQQAALDQKCIEIVEQVLTPIIARKIGEKALLGEDISLLDDDEREE
jgi:hypothetical protein